LRPKRRANSLDAVKQRQDVLTYQQVMGRKGNTQVVNSEWMLQLPCEEEARTFVNERSKDTFVRLHRKRCSICKGANSVPAPDRQACVDTRDGFRAIKDVKRLNSATTNSQIESKKLTPHIITASDAANPRLLPEHHLQTRSEKRKRRLLHWINH